MSDVILATGATGLVGSRFVELFGDQYTIANMDLTTGVDITKPQTLADFASDKSAHALLHLAAFTDTAAAFKEQGNRSGICYRVNVEGTQNIIDLCRAKNLHLIHVSTDFVFNGEKKDPYTENDPASPIEWYGETKAMAEDLVAKSGVSYSIVRIAYPYRALFDAKPDLVKKIRLGLSNGTLFPQFKDTTITPTFIDDIAKVFDFMVKNKPQGIFHAVGSTSLSPFELAQKIAVVFGFDKELVKEGSLTSYLATNPRPFARHLSLSNAKISALSKITMKSIDEGLAEIKKQGA